MRDSVPTFTAAELSRALDVTPQRIRQLLKHTRFSIRHVAGQETQTWDLEEIPSGIKARLEKAVHKNGAASIPSLLKNAAPRWEPEIPLPKINESQIAEASLRREALAPVLTLKKQKPVSVLITESAQRFSEFGGDIPSESTIRRLITTAIDRDRGHENFQRLELYLDDRLSPRDSQAEPAPEACRLPALALVLDSIENLSDSSSYRLAILKVSMEEVKRLQESGLSLEMARGAVVDTIAASGVNLSSSREALRKLIRRSWEKWLDGGQVIEALEDRPRSGRPALYIPTLEERNAMKTLNLQTGSVSLAARVFATRSDCPPELKAVILKERSSKHKLPPTIRSAAAITEAVRTQYKSPKAARLKHHLQPRSFDYRSTTRSMERLQPGQLWERDDMSINCLFWVPWPWGGDACSERYGVRLCRGQLLVSLDVGSQRFLSFNLLARTMDSYRADDIWSWMGHDYSVIGMPEIGERLERGTWKSKKIYGDRSVAWDGKPSIDEPKRIGGLRSLGINQITAHTPSAKEIERRFNFLQNVMGTIPGQIGRHRGQMEKETKLWMACRAGFKDPREHFIDYSSMLDEVQKALLFCNADKHEGIHVHGVPDQIWEESGAAQRLRKLPEDKAFLFARDRSEITVSRGHIQIRRKAPDGSRCAWWFGHESLQEWEGKKIQVYHDVFAPGAGVSIVDWRDRLICHAPLVEGCPQFSLDPTSRDETSLDRRKKFQNAVVSECRILDPRPDQKKKIMARISDGRGTDIVSTGVETSSRMFPGNVGGRNPRPGDDAIQRAYKNRRFTPDPTDEDLAKMERLEKEAIARGDLVPRD